MGRAASEVIARELAGGKTTVISGAALHNNPLAQQRALSAPGESTERDAAIAEGATRVVIGEISRVGNRLLIDVSERDPASGATLDNFSLSSPDRNDLYSLADAAAHHISPQVTAFETRNNEAIAAWARALEENDYAKVSDYYSRAVQADPQFASAWLSWAGAASGHGDRAEAANAVAREAGIEQVLAGVLPEGKVAEIRRLQGEGRVVAMAGDGINDAPALAQADVGFAMGSGTDVAIEAGDVTLLRADLAGIAQAIALSRATWNVMRQNLVWALGYNVLAIPAAALGFLSPVISSAAMAASSVSVVFNSLRLRKMKLRRAPNAP